jgi:hypothetical protein
MARGKEKTKKEKQSRGCNNKTGLGVIPETWPVGACEENQSMGALGVNGINGNNMIWMVLSTIIFVAAWCPVCRNALLQHCGLFVWRECLLVLV